MDTLKKLIEINVSCYFLLEKIKKHEEVGRKIRDLVRSITENSNDYDDKYMKIKFNSDYELPLNKMIEFPDMAIIFKAVFQENNKYYRQVF